MEPEQKKAIYPAAIFKEAWGLCLKHFPALVEISAIMYLPLFAIRLLLEQRLKAGRPGAASLLLGLVLFLIANWRYLALLLCAHKAQAGEPADMRSSLRGAGDYLWSYIGASLVNLFTIGLCFLAGGFALVGGLLSSNKAAALLIAAAIGVVFIAAAVYFLLRWSIYGVVCVAENAAPLASLQRSLRLVKDHINPVAGVYCLILLVSIVSAAPMIIPGAITGEGSPALAGAAVVYYALINIMLAPLYSAVVVILYNKLKETAEG